MAHLLLIHWQEAEAHERAARLAVASRHDVQPFWDQAGGTALRRVLRPPPEAVVLDLSRLPAHGREVATMLRQGKATRRVPIVFVGGAPEKVEPIRDLLPDATFTDWQRLPAALARALAAPPEDPVVPPPREYATPLPRKLGIAEGTIVLLLGAPATFPRTLGTLPSEVTLRRGGTAPAPLVLLFVRTVQELRRRLPQASAHVAAGGGLWIAWPKQAGKRTAAAAAGALDGNAVRAAGMAAGWVDHKVCAIDATWSALRFARARGAAKPGKAAPRRL